MPQTIGHSGRPARARSLVLVNIAVIASTFAAIAVAPTGDRLVVFVPPWSTPGRIMEIVGDAGGTLVNGGATDWIVVAEGNGHGFAGRLMAAGAMFVLDGRLGGACIRIGDYL